MMYFRFWGSLPLRTARRSSGRDCLRLQGWSGPFDGVTSTLPKAPSNSVPRSKTWSVVWARSTPRNPKKKQKKLSRSQNWIHSRKRSNSSPTRECQTMKRSDWKIFKNDLRSSNRYVSTIKEPPFSGIFFLVNPIQSNFLQVQYCTERLQRVAVCVIKYSFQSMMTLFLVEFQRSQGGMLPEWHSQVGPERKARAPREISSTQKDSSSPKSAKCR